MFSVKVKHCFNKRRPRNERIAFVTRKEHPTKEFKSDIIRNMACAINWSGSRRNHNNAPYVYGNIIFNH